MNFAYIRISSDKMSKENQRQNIIQLANEKKLQIDEWVEEYIGQTESINDKESINDRELGKLRNRLNSKDAIMISEFSRMGQNLTEIKRFLDGCIEQDIKVYTFKEKYEC